MEGSVVARESLGGLERLLSGRRLRFPADIERAFRADYAERWRSTTRAAFVFGTVTFAAFGLVDPLATSQSLREVWLLRFALGVPTAVAVVLLSYTSAFRRVMQPAAASAVFILAATIVGMEMSSSPTRSATTSTCSALRR